MLLSLIVSEMITTTANLITTPFLFVSLSLSLYPSTSPLLYQRLFFLSPSQGVAGNHENITPLVTMLPALLAKSASCYNPFVYAISHPKFRQVRRLGKPVENGGCIENGIWWKAGIQ